MTEKRRMFREPQWSGDDSPEAAATLEGWVAIQADAKSAGGDWDSLVANARRFPFDLAQRVVQHFEALRAKRVHIAHPGKLAWTALTEPAFTFSRFACEGPPRTDATPPKGTPRFNEVRDRREALWAIYVSLTPEERKDVDARADDLARQELGAHGSQIRLGLLRVDKRNEILERERADELARRLA